jgi:hypothetical protein
MTSAFTERPGPPGRQPDEAVVIIGGFPSVGENGRARVPPETRPRFTIGWTVGYDVALIKPGTYQLVTIVGLRDFRRLWRLQRIGLSSIR